MIGLIRLYQIALSPLLGPRCRFYPSCSAYALEALNTHGALKGLGLSVMRLARCHPWNIGGYDPVPHGSSQHNPNPSHSEKSDLI